MAEPFMQGYVPRPEQTRKWTRGFGVLTFVDWIRARGRVRRERQATEDARRERDLALLKHLREEMENLEPIIETSGDEPCR